MTSLGGDRTPPGAHLGGSVGVVEFYCDLIDEASMDAATRREAHSGGGSSAASAFRVPETPVRLRQSQETFSQTQSINTPLRNGTHGTPVANTSTIKQEAIKTLMKEEIGTRVFVVGEDWASSLYSDLVSDEKITAFLRKPTSGYAWFKGSASQSRDDATTSRLNGEWSSLPKSPKKESVLYAPLNAIIAKIVNARSLSKNGYSRKIHDTHKLALMHDNCVHATLPDTCIVAKGPSFQLPPRSLSKPTQRKRGVGYTNIAAVIDAKLEKTRRVLAAHVFQMALYIRCGT